MDGEDQKVPNVLDVLEMKYSMEIIQCVKNSPGATKSDVIAILGGNDRTIFLRIKDLIACGVLDFDDQKRKHNTIKLYLTPRGQELSVFVDELLRFVKTF